MGKDTRISWTHHTFNSWWGCEKVSPGCKKCYAEGLAKRVGQRVWGPGAPRRFFDDKHWNAPLKWDRAAAKARERHRVFCSSMADVFEDRRDLDEHRARLWRLIERTPHLDWLLLTKRPENMPGMAPERWEKSWPANVWAGATVENQDVAADRVRCLSDVPAPVLFLSCEPLLGPLDLTSTYAFEEEGYESGGPAGWTSTGRIIDWVIIGGESGGGARPFRVEWARALMAQCRDAGVACFVKQMGSRFWDGDTPVRLKDKNGTDPAEWPEDLRVQEVPLGGVQATTAVPPRSLPVIQDGAR